MQRRHVYQNDYSFDVYVFFFIFESYQKVSSHTGLEKFLTESILSL